ncbi:MAG TPA: hypothetical protein VNM89_02490 [Solirubrobacterales bacterium]|nr:hypothetical protein [Solirubrobacterales bacterium]
MGILDEAIREHLELKRQHGAGDSELKQLEDDAFGPAERPGDEGGTQDPFAEAPTEFMAAPEMGGEVAEVAEEPTSKREAPDIAALQEAPEPPAEQPQEEAPEQIEVEEEPEPIAEEPTAEEHQVVPEEPETPGPSTEEREAIADQPTEMFDVEAELRETLDRAPSDEEIVEEEISEPRLAPVDPLSGIDEDEIESEAGAPAPAPVEEEEEEDDFWDEQRLSDELNQALEAPSEETEVVFDVEEDEEIVEVPQVDEEPEEEEAPPPIQGDQDVLEDTPDFLEDSEDDQLWFEQKPPKDFDFDD